MKKLSVELKNCYGIASLGHSFEFGTKSGERAYAIYAPNGLMKTSFTKTFGQISQKLHPCEERYNRPTICVVQIDQLPIDPTVIHLLKSEIDISEDSKAITDILVHPDHKARYDALLVDLDQKKNKILNTLQKTSGVSRKEIEHIFLRDIGLPDFPSAIEQALSSPASPLGSVVKYGVVFDPKAIDVISSNAFEEKAKEFNERYQELFNLDGTIYKKGIFNPIKAETAFSTLDKQGFFQSGHRVSIAGDQAPLNQNELAARLEKIHRSINDDIQLQTIRTSLAKNASAQAIADLIECLPADQVEELLNEIQPEFRENFKKALWASYIQGSQLSSEYLNSYFESKADLEAIEIAATADVPRWTAAIKLFNSRFVDMPFTLLIANQAKAALGKEPAKLIFSFKDGNDEVHWSRSEIKTLSQGEKRALYLLNFIFEVEARKILGQPTLFVIDDVADSFDYKNKHAIVQYLQDLDENENFYQLILTHNYDFFRTLANTFVHRERCLMANRQADGISLSKAEGINNYFSGVFQKKIQDDIKILCATIPFTRNLIEYTKGVKNDDYLKLTSLLHWKSDTMSITVIDYLDIYNSMFSTKHTGQATPLVPLIYNKAFEITQQQEHNGLNLEDKIVLCMAIRLKAEEYLLNQIRNLENKPDYWCTAQNQFGALIKSYKKLSEDSVDLTTLDQVSVTVSTNIHLNAFMYEPILDLTIEHLIQLYAQIEGLSLKVKLNGVKP